MTDLNTFTPSRETRVLACHLAAEVCAGQLPPGPTLLSYVIMFETYIEQGADVTGEFLGWDVTEKPPVNLADVRSRLKEVLT